MLDIALEAGVSPETLRKIESGRVGTPSFPTIAMIAEVLEISLDRLWAEATGSDRAATPHRSVEAQDRSIRVS